MTIEMNARLSYHDKETVCLNIFNEMGEVYHGCTPENHPIIIKNKEEFKTAFTEALKINGPVVIDTLIDKDEFVLPMLPPGGSVDEIITKVEK